MTDPTIRKSVFLKADPQTVWDHLTRADLLGKWFHPATEDLSNGTEYTLTDGPGGDRMCWGRIEDMQPIHYMRWSFTVGPLNGVMTTVEWHVEPVIGGTRLSLEHSGLPADADGFRLVLALDKGWHGFLLNLHEL